MNTVAPRSDARQVEPQLNDELVQLVMALRAALERGHALLSRMRKATEPGPRDALAPAISPEPPETPADEAAPAVSREVCEARALIEARYAEPLTLRAIARHVGCSREQLARRFRRETGHTVHGYLVQVRVARAAADVRQGDKIEAVMLGVGYRGKRNFYRQFRARFGTTPGGYRAGPDSRGTDDTAATRAGVEGAALLQRTGGRQNGGAGGGVR